MITIHHLRISQCERIIWLCEELGIPYELKTYNRDPMMSPPALKNIPGNFLGRSPFIEDSSNGVKLAESGAICEYIVNKYGNGKLTLPPSHPDYASYLYWFHYANGNVQTTMICSMFVDGCQASADSQVPHFADMRLNDMLNEVDDRLGKTGKWLAGDEFTLAEIMTVYSLTTQRYFGPTGKKVDYSGRKNLLAWLKRVSAREAYQRAMAKGDPEMQLLTGATAPHPGLMAHGGVGSDIWKKKR